MENKVMIIHEENLAVFNEKLADLNKKLSKKGQPSIKAVCVKKPEMVEVEKMVATTPWTLSKVKVMESNHLYEYELSSEFNSSRESTATMSELYH